MSPKFPEGSGPLFGDDTSRYDRLCDAATDSRANRISHRDACFAFVERFLKGLIHFLEIPADRVCLASPDGAKGGAPLTVSAASYLGENGFWKTGIDLEIRRQTPQRPSMIVTLLLHVRKSDQFFECKLFPDAPSLQIPDADDLDLSPAYELVFEQLLASVASFA